MTIYKKSNSVSFWLCVIKCDAHESHVSRTNGHTKHRPRKRNAQVKAAWEGERERDEIRGNDGARWWWALFCTRIYGCDDFYYSVYYWRCATVESVLCTRRSWKAKDGFISESACVICPIPYAAHAVRTQFIYNNVLNVQNGLTSLAPNALSIKQPKQWWCDRLKQRSINIDGHLKYTV